MDCCDFMRFLPVKYSFLIASVSTNSELSLKAYGSSSTLHLLLPSSLDKNPA